MSGLVVNDRVELLVKFRGNMNISFMDARGILNSIIKDFVPLVNGKTIV
jgi:hypothetical protein